MASGPLRALACCLVASLLLAAGTVSAAHAVDTRALSHSDGPIVTDASAAPWSVLVNMGDYTHQCTGTIVSPTEVLTAAHCTLDSSGQQFPASAYVVLAGDTQVSCAPGLASILCSSGGQKRGVSAVRVIPGFVGASGATPDVAELTLSAPLTFGPAVEPIDIVSEGQEPQPGATGAFDGWGLSAPGSTDDHEHTLQQTLVAPWRCLSGEAATLCASSSSGDACTGDSGSGLVDDASGTPVLIGILDLIFPDSSQNCGVGGFTGYTDLASPEVHEWLSGDSDVPSAPRTSGRADVSDRRPQVGSTAICRGPSWTGHPSERYQFIDAASHRVLQSGPATYVVGASEAGRRLACVAVASTSGGTTYAGPGNATGTVLPRSPAGITLRLDPSSKVTVRHSAPLPLTVTLVASLRGAKAPAFRQVARVKKEKTVSLRNLRTGTYQVCVAWAPQGVYRGGKDCSRWVHT